MLRWCRNSRENIQTAKYDYILISSISMPNTILFTYHILPLDFFTSRFCFLTTIFRVKTTIRHQNRFKSIEPFVLAVGFAAWPVRSHFFIRQW